MSRFDYVYETVEEGGLILQIVQDPNPFDPRGDDQLGYMLCWHPDYVLGDGQFKNINTERGAVEHLVSVGDSETMAEVAEYIRKELGGINIISLFLYDHSGISISAGATIPDDEPSTDEDTTVDRGSFGSRTITGGYSWDTSMVGFIYTTPKLIEMIGAPLDSIDRQLRGEVEEYNDYLTGNAWGYVLTKPCDHADEHKTPESVTACPHSEVLDSCWGYIGDPKYAMEEGMAVLKAELATA
jgi:hypothetical protein